MANTIENFQEDVGRAKSNILVVGIGIMILIFIFLTIRVFIPQKEKMKVRASVKKASRNCRVIKKDGVIRVICTTANPAHFY